MTPLQKINDALYGVTKTVSIALFAGMVILSILQVLCRYIFQVSLSFTEELARFLFIWVTFLGTSMALRKNQHVRMELLLNRLSGGARKIADFVGQVISMCIYFIMIAGGLVVVYRTMEQTSAALNLPMGYVYLAVPVCGIMLLLQQLGGGNREAVKENVGGDDL